MKDLNIKLGSLMLGLSVITTSVMAGQSPRSASTTTASSTKTVSEVEKEDLLFMREEEKLARDVYIFAYAQWGNTVFDNISESEQEHTDKILSLLEKYNLEDPATETEGEFTDGYLQNLYNDLITDVQNSEISALYVGTAIEEIDMIDILDAIERTDNRDIKTVYENLLDGSKSHLRAFVQVLETKGIIYEPKFIDVDFYNEIIGE